MSFLGNRPHRPQATTVTRSTICPHCHKDITESPKIATKAEHHSVSTMIEDIETNESTLTPWEREFIDSVSEYIGKGRQPSEKQLAIILRIWEEKT
jgi:hypothetical protein